MAGIIESILINISASVQGAAGIAGLTGGIGALSGKLLGLNAGLQIVQQVSQSVGQMVGQLEDWANAANRAATNTKVFELTLARFNVGVDGANAAAERLAKQFGLSITDIQDNMTTLVRVGFRDIGQLEATMRGAAASAIAAGRDAQAGFDAVSDAAATQLSARLNGIGVAQNLSTYYKKLSDDLNKNVDDLTEAERAQALYNLILEATSTEVEALDTIQNDYVKSQQASKLASENLSRALGELVTPVVVRYKLATAEATNTVIEAIKAYQQGGNALEALSQKYPALARVLAALKPAADEMKRGLLDAWAGISDYANRVLLPAFEQIRPVVERVWKYIPPLIASAGQLIGQTFKLIADLWVSVLKPVWDALAPVVEYAITGVLGFLKTGFDFISGIFTAIRALIAGDWRGAWDTFSETVKTAGDKVDALLAGLGTSIRQALDRMVGAAIEKGKNFGLNLRDGIISGVSGLAQQLTEKIEDAINKMTDRLPQWFKDRFGITALTETLEGGAAIAGGNAAAARAGIAGRAAEIDPKTLNDFQKFILSATETGRGLEGKFNDKADSLVDYCARWVRDTLGDAAPEMRKAINALFLNNPGKGGVPTAVSAYGNFQKAGLARDYKTFADLKPGDTVFYTDGGQNHAGVYIGNGQVRGNNRVTYQDNGGRFGPGGIATGRALDNGKVNPVGDVDINRLGKVTGYVAATELLAYLAGKTPVTGQPKAGTPANVPTVKPPPADTTDTTDKGGPFTAAQYAQAQKILATIEAAQKALQAKPGDVGLANALTAAQKASEKFSKSTSSAADALKAAQAAAAEAKKGADSYVASLADLNKYGDAALKLIKAQEQAQKSGSAAQISAANGAIARFSEQGKAQAAVLDAERAAYQSRQQLSDKATQDEQARAALSLQIARDAAAGREADARAGLDALKRSQAERLDVAQEDAGKRAAILRETGPQILAAEAAVNLRVRRQAVAAAAQTAKDRLGVAGANAAEIEAQRKATAVRAYQAEKTANSTARSEQQRAERGAGRTAAEEQKQLAAELAGLKIDSAKATAGRLKDLADEDIRRYEGDLGRQLELTTKYAQEEFERQRKLAEATRQLAYDQAKGKPNEAALRTKAQEEYLQTMNAARIAQQATLKTSQDALNRSLDEGTKAGNAALDSLKGLTLGGRDLAAAVKPLGSTDGLFAELSGRIVELASDLDDPDVAAAWIAQIEAMGKAGQLTALQVIRLKQEVNDLAGIEASLNEFGMRVSDTTGAAPRYQTDDELSGRGQPANSAAAAYLNLESVIQDIGQFSRSELESLVSQTGMAADEADKLFAAWEAVYGQFDQAAQGSDATTGPGKGLLNNARPDDASRGVLAPGEADTLLTAMIGADPLELGKVLADLVAKGFGESDLAKLIREQIAGLDFDDLALMVSDVTTGEKRFQTEDELSGKAEKVRETQQAFIDLGSVIESVMTLSREELDALLTTAGLLPDEVEKITAAWQDFHRETLNTAALDEQLAPVAAALQSVYDELGSGNKTAGEARVAFAAIRAQLEGIGGPAAQNLIATIDETAKSFDDLGGVSAQVTAALAKVRGETEAPYAGLIRNLEEMKTKPGAARAEIDALIAALQKLNGEAAKTEGLQKATDKINEYADYARKAIPAITAALSAFGASDDVAAAWGENLSSMVEDVTSFAKNVIKILANPSDIGAWVGAITQAITTIFTYHSRRAKEAAAELKKTVDYGNQFRFDKDGYGTRTTTSQETGFLWWKKTITTEQIDEAGKAIALSFENAIATGLGNGFQEAVKKNDSSILAKSINTQVKQAAFKGLVDAFLNSAAVAAVFGPVVKKLIEAFKSGNSDMIRSALDELKTGVANLKPAMDALVEVGKAIDEALPDGDALTTVSNDAQKALDLTYQAGLVSTEAYESRKLAIALKTIQDEMDARLKAAGLTEDQIAQIRARAALETQAAQAVYDRAAEDRARQFQGQLLSNEEAALKIKRASGLLDEEAYQAALLTLTLQRIELERSAALHAAGLTAEQIAAINRSYDLQAELAQAELAQRIREKQEAESKRLAEESKRQIEDAARQRESMLDSWRGSLRGGIAALLDGGDSLMALQNGIRDRIAQGIQEGFIAKRIARVLDPLFEQLDTALSKGLDPAALIAQIGKLIPTLNLQLQTDLGPIWAALNAAIPRLTDAVTGLDKTIQDKEFTPTTIVSYGRAPVDSNFRQQLARFT